MPHTVLSASSASQRLVVASYNIHKGLSPLNRRLVLHDVREALAHLSPDVVFLQEVQGEHHRHARRFSHWPALPQHEFLAGEVWTSTYGRNASYQLGHHGNALLSRFPIRRWHNHDLTLHRFEQRGLLHCVVDVAGWEKPLHALCVHLNLRARDRRRQLDMVIDCVHQEVPQHSPLVLAGDFNDWQHEASTILQRELGLHEAFETLHGRPAKSFPARLPLLNLDRIYTRGFAIETAEVLLGQPWRSMSDHAPLLAVLDCRHARHGGAHA
ncbi:endonuclease/exonuclease/phosphatase family protein [Chitinilyticum litopenaei]|uniref:endonuclease/exonuclease/phosphatase family protein n=1 Tax=Chitinilyticum litopenaei TaxID=1121276 RepID=UPI000687ACCD|nr:endonuclease/exonuclease/phosphatase family protein [Chitinilyticum litopenaei]